MSRVGDMGWTTGVTERPTISDLGLNPGKKAWLFRILFQHGLCNGTALFLPTTRALSTGRADAVGYTLYVGSPARAADFAQYRQVREEAARLGMPLIAWAYPRGSAFQASGGGADSFYAVDYAARVASELGADMVKVKFPRPEKRAGVPAGYDDDFSPRHAMEAVVRSANRTLVLVSGGSMAGDEATLEKARQSLEAGATGLIFGRNIWQREHDESLRLISKLQEILVKHSGYSIAFWERRHGSFGENMIFPS